MKNAGKARSYGLYRHLRTSKEIIENLLNYSDKYCATANSPYCIVNFACNFKPPYTIHSERNVSSYLFCKPFIL